MSADFPQPSVQTEGRQASGAGIIALQGEVTGFAEDALMAAYAEASAGATPVIILDFSGLQYMNSSGIGLLVTLLIRAQRQQQRLLACGLTDHYRQIFDLTRLNEVIGIYDSQAEALAAVAAAEGR